MYFPCPAGYEHYSVLDNPTSFTYQCFPSLKLGSLFWREWNPSKESENPLGAFIPSKMSKHPTITHASIIIQFLGTTFLRWTNSPLIIWCDNSCLSPANSWQSDITFWVVRKACHQSRRLGVPPAGGTLWSHHPPWVRHPPFHRAILPHKQSPPLLYSSTIVVCYYVSYSSLLVSLV